MTKKKKLIFTRTPLLSCLRLFWLCHIQTTTFCHVLIRQVQVVGVRTALFPGFAKELFVIEICTTTILDLFATVPETHLTLVSPIDHFLRVDEMRLFGRVKAYPVVVAGPWDLSD